MSKQLLDALCRESFDAFAAKAFEVVEPGVTYDHNWHISCIAEHLQALHDDTLPDGKRRLCVNVPPRTLKSYLCSIAFPAWAMGKKASEKFICTSYNFTLAREMSQKSRILFESEWYQNLFPETRIDDRQNEKHNFWTTQRGMYYSSALMSCTGRGAGYVVIDDPINPKEAVSDTVRIDTNATIRSTLPTRFNDLRKSKWLLIMQRVHDDDPTGNLVEGDDRWYKLKLPGENRSSKTYSYGINGLSWDMTPGELLFPARLTRQVLDDLESDLGEYNYAGQILQEPVPVGGGELRPEWLQYYGEGGVNVKRMNVAILVDPSGGETSNKRRKKLSDYTAMMVVGLGDDNNYYLLDAIRDRLNPTERIDALFDLHRKWNTLCGKSPKVGWEKYGLQSDIHYIKKKQVEETYNFPVIELGGAMAKEDRIRRLIPDMQNGRWYYPAAINYTDKEGRLFNLVKEIIDGEMATFPRSRFDDMLDAKARIYEPDLFMNFPKPKQHVTMATAARRLASSGDSWEDF